MKSLLITLAIAFPIGAFVWWANTWQDGTGAFLIAFIIAFGEFKETKSTER